MSNVPYFKCYPSDFLSGVVGLDAQEIGVYTVVLMMIYDRGGPVACDYKRLGLRCGLRPTSVQKVVERLIEYGKLHLDPHGRLTNSRAEKEVKSREKLAENSRKNGTRGGRKPAQRLNEINGARNPAGFIQATHAEPDTRNQKPEARSLRYGREATGLGPGHAGGLSDLDLQAKLLAQLPPGIDWPLRNANDLTPIRECLERGADLEKHVLPVVREEAARTHAAGRALRSWKVFQPHILSKLNDPVVLPQAAAPAAQELPDHIWRGFVADWMRSRHWPPCIQSKSQPPDSPRTRVPAHILAEFNIPRPTRQAA